MGRKALPFGLAWYLLVLATNTHFHYIVAALFTEMLIGKIEHDGYSH
jgi:hypothetical protein